MELCLENNVHFLADKNVGGQILLQALCVHRERKDQNMAASLIPPAITHTLCTRMSNPPALLCGRIWHNPSLVHTSKLISQTHCSPVRLHNINSLQKQGNGFSDPDPRGTAHAGFLLPDSTEQTELY